ncbi:virulence factor SrfC family protein [Capnocytophaga canimorsus]|uniref:virulence factor SrfC family protein n=1 Tax=Capnocytophaga canimorsus TaxID=28188 RepID=UPI00385E61D7
MSTNIIIKAQEKAYRKGLEWAKTFLRGTDLSVTKELLIKNKIKIKRIHYASELNPAAAVFGESQVGKSYLVDFLLSSKRGDLKIYGGKDEQGQDKYCGFLESINPIGMGGESTSLVSRFTTKKTWIDDRYPIKVVMLSSVDIVLTICDSFYNDVQNHNFPTKEGIKEKIKELQGRYAGKPKVQEHITEIDIFEIKEYFNSGLFEKGEIFLADLKKTQFFEHISEFIHAVPVQEWKDIFAFLWNNNAVLTEMFLKLINTFSKLNFQRDVYTNIDAILRVNGTILQVNRIYELFGVKKLDDGRIVEEAKIPTMKVWLGTYEVEVNKSEFCALASELVLKVEDHLEEEKEFMKSLDIMDFPGARSREKLDENIITQSKSCVLLLRGKVAYLFNKYSQQYLISNLLFCHHEKNSNVKTLSLLMKGWIEGIVGKTPKEREEFMQLAEIPPLFLVGTKFNTDLKRTPNDDNGTEEEKLQAKANRWKLRFQDTLTSVIGETKQNRWFSEWTTQEAFKNIYLLRSYNFSCRDGIFEGYLKKKENGNYVLNYNEDGTLVGELKVSDDYRDFLVDLKQTFLDNAFVKQHFSNPEKSWNEAVSCNKDGSEWIIENLTKSSRNALISRKKRFDNYLRTSLNEMCEKLKSFYHDDESDQALQNALQNAGNINLKMDILFGRDKYFFAEFIETMLLREDKLHDVILNVIRTMKVLKETDMGELFAIRDNAKINPMLSQEENLELLQKAYYLSSIEQTQDFLKQKNIKIQDIINPPKVKNFARIIVEEVQNYWLKEYLDYNRFQSFIERGLTEKDIENLFGTLKALYVEKLNITEKIIEHIRPYVSKIEGLDDMAEMLADICSEKINRFVNTMGTAYFYAELWEDLQETVRRNDFDIKVEAHQYDQMTMDEDKTREDLKNVFSIYDNIENILNESPVDKRKLSYFSSYHAYRRWTDNMKLAFLATCGIPKYDINMNNALRTVFVDHIFSVPEFNPLFNTELGLKSLRKEA